jgi:AcrR family transcriptional regulator
VLLFSIGSDQLERRLDPRTVRTYQALSGALVDLMRTREFNEITVQDLLDRAGVGRATFYSHFRNKDDFLLTDLERMLSALEEHFERSSSTSRRVAPIAELFSHFGNARDFAAALGRSGRMEAVLDIASGHLARIIERRLHVLGVQPRELPLNVAARVFGAMATELAKWWMERQGTITAQQMDERFHELVWRGIGQDRRPSAP